MTSRLSWAQSACAKFIMHMWVLVWWSEKKCVAQVPACWWRKLLVEKGRLLFFVAALDVRLDGREVKRARECKSLLTAFSSGCILGGPQNACVTIFSLNRR